MSPSEQIFVALDLTDPKAARSLARKLSGLVGGFKLGLEFFTANGPSGVKSIADMGLKVFLDLKLHDIPNTVSGAIRAATATGASILNVHTSGGKVMMQAAAKAATEGAALHGVERPIVVGVTVLTSLNNNDLETIGQKIPTHNQVLRLAKLAKASGLDGIVCSPEESASIRDTCGKGFIRIVPGIRPPWTFTDDQKRFTTPKEALIGGASLIVIGRPITQAEDPVESVFRIVSELEAK